MIEETYEINFWVYIGLAILSLLTFAVSLMPAIALNQFFWFLLPNLSLFNLFVKSVVLIFSFNIFIFVMPVIARFFNKLLDISGFRVAEGEFPINSRNGLSWWVQSNFITSTLRVAHLLRIPSLTSWLCRLLGARIGNKTSINGIIYDPALVEIGRNCLIANCVISPHMQHGGMVYIKKVKIGNNVTIGHNVVVTPGVIIDDNVIVGVNSIVPKNKHLTAGVWAGNPVRKIK